jgi:hypothetical protein
MPAKKDLTAQQSEPPVAPLHRGRGLRLSRAAKQSRQLSSEAGAQLERPTRAAVPPVEPAAAPPEPVAPPAAQIGAHGQAVAQFEPEQLEPVREKRKLKLRKDLLKECKRLARAQDRKLYQVIEAALESYIGRHGERE